MPAAEGTPATILIITGFLGSGKTTLLNGLIRKLAAGGTPGSAFGVIVNDFGPVAVDRDLVLGANPELLAGREEAVLEIAGGSIFCSCLESAFLDGLRYYRERRPELLLIETSGLSDPSSVRRVLTVDDAVKGAFEIGPVICVLDAADALDLLEVTEAARRQVQASSLLVVNKTDLVGPGQLERIRAALAGFNPAARIIETTRGRLEPELLRGAGAPSLGVLESLNTPGTRPASVLVGQRELGMEALKRFLESIQGHVLRIKGFYEVAGETYFVENDRSRIVLQHYRQPVSELGLSVLFPPEERGAIEEAWRRAVEGSAAAGR